MNLRWYQTESIEKVYKYLRERAGHPCIVLPTGAGKTPVLAQLCHDAVIRWDGRVLVVSHVKELLEQSASKIQYLCPTVNVGLYSAGLNSRDTANPIIVAGIQSIHDKAALLGRFDLLIIDEAHLIPASGDGMYRELIAALLELNPDLRIIGLTATPFRLDSGPICTPDGILNEVCYEVGIRPLIAQGFLSKLIGKAGVQFVDTRFLKVVLGEFEQDKLEAAYDAILDSAIQEIIEKTLDRKSVLIFTQNVSHGKKVAEALRDVQRGIFGKGEKELKPALSLFDIPGCPVPDNTVRIAADWLEENEHPVENLRFCLDNLYSVGEVYGGTKHRDEILEKFKNQKIKYLVNVNVLTTGFDATNVDCVVLLRSTVSGGLFYQMCGRGFRIHEGKENCLVLDFGENILRHGPVDLLTTKTVKKSSNQEPVAKICPECRTVNAGGVHNCVDCGYAFPFEDRVSSSTIKGNADSSDPVSNPNKVETHPVDHVTYHVHTKKDADETAPKTMRVTYHLDLASVVNEWVCVEHEGFARRKALAWWAARSRFPMPDTALEAVQYAEHGLLADTISIETKKNGNFNEIVDAELEDKPFKCDPCPECEKENLRVIVPCDPPQLGKIVCGWCNHYFKWASKAEVEFYGLFNGEEERIGLISKSVLSTVEEYSTPADNPF